MRRQPGALARTIAESLTRRDTPYFLQKVDYSYNIRGWLKGINNSASLAQTGQPTDLFAFKINYNTPETAQALFNGNIAETFWKTSSDITLRKYSYQYDALNRLFDAAYSRPTALNNLDNYGEQLTYDINGNIKTLKRYGETDDTTTRQMIDDLTYIYPDNSNQLAKVIDAEPGIAGFKDGTNTDDDYGYDVNGNMINDKNKGITTISYNHLNLPVKITFDNSSTKKIEYIYNATGVKVSKKVTDGTVITTTDYLSGYQYVNSVLQFFPTAEGYVKNTPVSGSNSYSYVYNYTDHLGNVRLSYTKQNNVLTILEENHYYPFGLKHNGYNYTIPTSNKYKYNGQELQDEIGLNMYDMPFRDYDPAIGRWTGIDPVIHYEKSPYNGYDNNPVFFADPSGADSQDMFGRKRFDERGIYIAPLDRAETVDYRFAGDNDGSGGGGGEWIEDDACPSCKTEEDWAIYYAQAENTAAMLGEDLFLGGKYLTVGADEDGHTLYYLDGKLMDLVRYKNRAHALGSLLSDAALIEAPIALLKALGGLFKSGASKAALTAYETALAGGKHSGFLKNYLGRSADEIGKAITSMQSGKQGINIHLDKIENPTKYVPNWNTLRASHQQSLIKGWQNTVTKHREQIQILQTILGK